MRIRARYLSIVRDFLGVFEDVIELEGNEYTIREVLEIIRDLRPKLRRLESMIPMMWVYLNGKHVHPMSNKKVKDGDVVTLMPTLYEGG